MRIFDRAWDGQAFIYVPAVALWEVSILHKIGQIKLSTPFERWTAALTIRQGFDLLPLDLELMTEAIGININGDIFDEAIVAAALIKDLPLITKDTAIADSNLVEVIW